MAHITTICQVRFPKLEKRLPKVFKRFMLVHCLLVLGCRGKKKDFCHSTVSVTKVSSQHMASGIAAVMTLPCSGAPGPGPGAPPFTPFYQVY